MSVAELSNLLGKEGMLDINGLQFMVRIIDVRKVFGRTDYKVTPVSGTGTIWVESHRLKGLV